MVAPIVAFAVFELLARVDERRFSIIASLTLALLATAPRVLGTPFESIGVGAFAVAVLCAYPAYRGARRMLHGAVVHERTNVAFIAVFAVVMFLGVWIEVDARLWDGDFGHFGFSSGIARGVLPPEHPLFPGEPLRYHVGFDVLVALVIVSGVPVGAAVHVVSIALLALLLLIARDVGRALAIADAWVPALVLLGYAPTSLCLAGSWASWDVCSAWFPSTWVSAQTMPPTVFSSFFQHPQGLAMPIALACMLLALTKPSFARTVLASLSLVALAHCQIAYFASAGLGIGAALLLHRPTHAFPLLIAAAIAYVTSDIAGGANELRFGRGYFGDDANPLRYLAIFGLTLFAPLIALVLQRRSLLVRALAVASIAGFVVASAFTYARSWDIVKFFAIGAFFGNVCLAVVLAHLTRGLSRGARATTLALALAALCTVSASFWAVRSGVLNGVIAPHYALPRASALGEELLRVAGDDIAPRDVVLTPRVDIWHQGFHVAGADHRKYAKGQLIDTARAEGNAVLARTALRTFDTASLEALSVDWILVPTSMAGSMQDRQFVHHARVLDHDLYRVGSAWPAE